MTLDFPPARGGIQRYLCGIVSHCYDTHDAVFIAGMPRPASNPPAVKARLRYFTPPPGRINRKIALLALLLPCYRLCKRSAGALSVECGNVYAGLVAWLVRKVTRQPYRVYTYGTELVGLQTPSLKSRILTRVLNDAEVVFTLGKYTEELLQKIGITAPVERVPPRIDLPETAALSSDPPKERSTVLCVGRLVKHKGHAVLIQAALLLARENRFRIVIVGDGPEFDALQHQCASSGVGDMVSIKRNLSDAQVRREFCESDIFVLPSLETGDGAEGFGIVLLEAMAFHLPIVASATGGIVEVLDNGACGLLVEPGNAAALAGAISGLAKNPALAQKITQKAYTRLLDRYVWK